MSENHMKIKAKQIDTTGGLTLQGETINRLTHTDADGKLKAAALLKIDTANARLGIGTTTPTATLDITGDTAGEAQVMIRQHNDDADGPDLVFTRSRGYEASKSTLQSGDNVGRVNAEAWTGSAYTQNGTYGWTATDTAGNSEFSLKTRVSGTFADRFAVDSTGKVKISDAYTLPDSDGTNGQVLTTNGSGALSFADAAAGGASSLNELSDVTITSPAEGHTLVYESDVSKFVNEPLPVYKTQLSTSGTITLDRQGDYFVTLDGASSVTTTIAELSSSTGSPINGTITFYSRDAFTNYIELTNATAYDNYFVSRDTSIFTDSSPYRRLKIENGQKLRFRFANSLFYHIEDTLGEASDVTITSPSDGQVLSYDNASSKWINATPTASPSPAVLTFGYPDSLTDWGITYQNMLCAGSTVSGWVAPLSGRIIALSAIAEVTNTDTNNYLRIRPFINGSGSSARDIEITVGTLGIISDYFDFADTSFSAGDVLSVKLLHNNNGATTANHAALLLVEFDT